MGIFVKSITILSIFATLLTLSYGSVDKDNTFKNSLENFSHKIFHELVQSHRNKNIICSPFSIQTCLTMARMGADGETAKEMDDVLGFTLGQTLETVADNYYALLSRYENSSILNLANKVYVMDGYEPNDQYDEVLAKKFLSPMESVDFKENAEAIATMNDWIELKTNHKIKAIISSEMLHDTTRFVLLSVVYFKGEWTKPFLPRKTVVRNFYTDDTNTVQVPMMFKRDNVDFGILKELDATAIRMSYKDSDLSMLIFLPRSRTGLADMEEKLKDIELDTLTQKMGQKEVAITLPKFKAEFKVDLKSTLSKLGINGMFEKYELSKIIKTDEPLTVSSVLHMTVIEVSEMGTEAAAVTTGFGAAAVAMPRVFRADHPFHYIIVNADNIILFQGNVLNF